jgi:DNA polymerase III epsilon subunit-like protein
MPNNDQSKDIYIPQQLSLTFTGPRAELAGAVSHPEDQTASNGVPGSGEDKEKDKTSDFNIDPLKEEKSASNVNCPGLIRSVIESEKGIIPSVIEKESPAAIVRPHVDRYLFVDLETGGLYPNKHAVLQVAAVITDLDLNIKAQFMSYIQPHPELLVTQEALMINQLSLDRLQTAPPEKAVALALSHFARLIGPPPRFAGYNCQFDLEFLSYLWQRHDLLPAPYQVPWLDIYAVAKSRLGADAGLPNFKLASVADHFGLNTTGAHDALADLIMTIEIAKLLQLASDKAPSLKNGIDLETARFSVLL